MLDLIYLHRRFEEPHCRHIQGHVDPLTLKRNLLGHINPEDKMSLETSANMFLPINTV